MGGMGLGELVSDLKRSLHDAAGAFDQAADADFKRLLNMAAVAMQAKRPRTLLGSVTLQAGQPVYPITAPNFARYKTYQWGSPQRQPWEPCYPGALPRVSAEQQGSGWVLAFDPAPSALHIAAYGATFPFWYFASHTLGDAPENTTLQLADRPLLLLRAQAEAMRELSMRNINKPTQLRDGLTAAPRNSTPAALYQALLQEWEAAA